MITVKIDPKSVSRFGQRLRDFAAVTKQTARDCVKEQGALFCQDMAVFTPPLVPGGGGGLTKSAEIAGNNAVSGDIRKLFIAVGDRNISSQRAMVMMNLAAATRDNNMALFDKVIAKSPTNVLRGLSPIMRKIMNDQDHTRAFAKAKNFLSRVPIQRNVYGFDYATDLRTHHNRVKAKFGGRIKRGQRIGVPRLLVDSKETLDEYIKERQKAVGKVKSGWLGTLRQIPPPLINGIPKNFGSKLSNALPFISRHSVSDGYAVQTENASGYTLTVGNRQGNINNIAGEARALEYAIENRAKMMGLRIKRFLDLAARKSNSQKKS
jgi:hypothetical protein